MATTLLHEGTNDYTALIGAATGQSIGEKTVTISCGGCYVENDLQVKVKAYASYGTFSNLVTSGTEGQYTENTSNNTIIPTGGYLYLSGGYYPKTKISLAHLIPDSGTATLLDYDTGVSYIRSGKSAWDKNGKEIVGTLADTSLSISGGDLSSAGLILGSSTMPITPSFDLYTGIGTAAKTSLTKITDSTYGIIPESSVPATGTYIRIDPNASASDVKPNVSITVTRTAASISGDAGYYAGGGIGLDVSTYSDSGTTTVSPDVKAGTNRYIKDVTNTHTVGTPTLSQGAVSITNTSQSNGRGDYQIGITPSTVITKADSSSTAITESTYGIITSLPNGANGANYLKLNPEATEGRIKLDVSIPINRGDITESCEAGLTKAKSAVVAVASAENVYSATTSKTISALPEAGVDKYIPIVSPRPYGGGIPAPADAPITVSGTGNINVSPTVSLKNSSSEAVIESSFGITESVPSGSYMILDPDASGDGTKNISASVSITRAAITASSIAGITTGTGTGSIVADTKTYSGSGSVGISVNSTGNKFISLVSPSGSVSTHNITNASATMSTEATRAGGGRDDSVAAPSGVLSSAPGDLSSYAAGYIKITPSLTTSNGSSTAKAKGSIGAGITSGGTSSESTADTKPVGVTTTTTNAKTYYIKIYGGTYTVV